MLAEVRSSFRSTKWREHWGSVSFSTNTFLMQMKRLAFALTVGLLFVIAAPDNADAQSFKVGPRATVSLGEISDVGGDLGIGANARVGIPSIPVDGHGAFTYYFANENYTIWSLDINAVYPLPVTGPVSPYVGGGLGIVNSSYDYSSGNQSVSASDTDTALNLIGGVEFNAGGITPFAELNAGIGGDWDRFGISGGILFGF